MNHSLNIVSFDVPFPANYGGVIDVYYKLVWLNRTGVKIHLHCFDYGRGPSKELERLCEKVYYYPRKTGIFSSLSLLPYTVKSRQSKDLEKNLLTNDFPILFEVLHTCYLLNDERFKSREKIYRHSNIEHEYYKELSKTERNFWKKCFLKIEARKLKRFEPILNHADLILAVNQKDTVYFKEKYPSVTCIYLPSFHANEKLDIKPGKSDYILFHGNLSVSENYEAALWLIEQVFSKINHQVIIAGLNPPEFLIELVRQFKNMELKASPNENEMQQLISQAQCHILYTAQATGLKLKLLNVLFNGRFVICNAHMISGTNLKENESLILADSTQEFISAANNCMKQEFSNQLKQERETLIENFDNEQNAKKLIESVFGT